MSINNLLAIRYSEAVISAGLVLNLIEKIKSDFDLLQEIIQKGPKFILSRVLPKQIKTKVWSTIIERHQFNELTNNFLNLLIKNNRLYLLKEIIANFMEKLKEYHGIKEAVFITAIPVGQDTVSDVKKTLEQAMHGKVEVQLVTNPKLLGGFILKTGSHMLDCSLSAKLEKLRQKVQGVRFN